VASDRLLTIDSGEGRAPDLQNMPNDPEPTLTDRPI